METPDERLVWLLAIATVPAGVVGLVAEHALRVLFAYPLAASVFLFGNGLVLLVGEWARRRGRARGGRGPGAHCSRRPPARHPRGRRGAPGRRGASRRPAAGLQPLGVTMAAGLLRGLDHEDAARFSFLLATLVILAAGLSLLPTSSAPTATACARRCSPAAWRPRSPPTCRCASCPAGSGRTPCCRSRSTRSPSGCCSPQGSVSGVRPQGIVAGGRLRPGRDALVDVTPGRRQESDGSTDGEPVADQTGRGRGARG
ncbi:MAG: undecaprenyl-diphosphate phosphatase [Chloroflexota bacterium]